VAPPEVWVCNSPPEDPAVSTATCCKDEKQEEKNTFAFPKDQD
jgi:hypothetical protein